METSAPLVYAIVNNAVTPQLAHQSDATTSSHSHLALFSGRLAALDFVMKRFEARAVW